MKNKLINDREFKKECEEYLSKLFGIIIKQRKFLTFESLNTTYDNSLYFRCKFYVNGFLRIIEFREVIISGIYRWVYVCLDKDDYVEKMGIGNTISEACEKLKKEIEEKEDEK